MSALLLHGIHKRYGAIAALVDVDLGVAAGSRTAIVGPSGSGKTTLLRIIAGFDVPDSGTVMLNGRLLADGPRAVPAHQRVIGYVPQDGALFPHLTVEQNIGFGLSRKPSERAGRVRELMELVSLDRAMLGRWPHELSGGQQQRVALARALAQKPSLMLLDEPFSALDTGLRAATRKAVAQLLSGAGITTILVTHDQAEALSFADQLAVMREGRLVQVGDPVHVYWHPKDEATASLLGEAIVLPARISDGFAFCALGRVAVADANRNGAARIMLRPEQLQFAAGGACDGDEHGCFGVVTDIDFGGPTCSVSLLNQSSHPGDPRGGPSSLHVRCFSTQAPALGASVRIAIAGTAHVLDAAGGADAGMRDAGRPVEVATG